ncbi:hypothetical protein ACHAXS_010554 [Conticribra weissflogii]
MISGGDNNHADPNAAPLSPRSRRKSSKASSSTSTSRLSAAAAAANKKKSALSPQTVEYLKSWILHPAHIEHPYPTEEEKSKIMAETGIELKQLTNWFVNNRKRFWKPKVEELKRQMSSGSSSLSGCGTLAEAAAKAGVQLAAEEQPQAHASKKIKLTSQSSISSIPSASSSISSSSKSHFPTSPRLSSSTSSNSTISIISSPREMRGKTLPAFRQKHSQSQQKSPQQLLEDELLVSPTTVIDPLLATTSTSALDAFQFDDFNLIPPSASCEIQDPVLASANAANIKMPPCPPILPLAKTISSGGNFNNVDDAQTKNETFQNLESRRHSVASFNSASNTFQNEDTTANVVTPTSFVIPSNNQPAAAPSSSSANSVHSISVNSDGDIVAESSTTTLASALDSNCATGFEGFNCGVGFCDHLQSKMVSYFHFNSLGCAI